MSLSIRTVMYDVDKINKVVDMSNFVEVKDNLIIDTCFIHKIEHLECGVTRVMFNNGGWTDIEDSKKEIYGKLLEELKG